MFDDPAKTSYSKSPEDKGVIGVIQMINKVSYDGQLEAFDEEDVQVMDLFAKFVGPKLAHSSMLNKSSQSGKEGSSDEAHLALGAPGADEFKKRSSDGQSRQPAMDGLQELDEDDEEAEG